MRPLNPNLAAVFPPPVMEARRWIAETTFPANRPLLNLSQAAPVAPPPQAMRRAMAEAVAEVAELHLYGPVLGDPELREAVAARTRAIYGGTAAGSEVAITSGCNQAFCAAVMSLCGPGDAVMVPVPWYFNHKMWLDMAGIATVPIPCEDAMRPDLGAARAAMTPAVKAILLVTPNNPSGAEYPAGLIDAFHELARAWDAVLILDETYRDFLSGDGAPHGLFARESWRESLIHLYSFSKVFRLTGHRVGAIVTGSERLAEIEKFLDAMTICPSRVGQFGALYGLTHLDQWVAGERAEILARRKTLVAAFARDLPDWRILGAGAYFAWVEPPFAIPSDVLARRLVAEQSLLVLPGTMFAPAASEGRDWGGERMLRIAFANADASGIAEMTRRLADFRL